jgi:hypothetical protein
MQQLNLISFFTLNLLGACFLIDNQSFFPSKLIFQAKSKVYLLSVLDDYLQEAKKKFASKQNFVNLNKFLELDVSQGFVNYSSFDLLFQDEFQDTIEYHDFEFFYGLNPWDKKLFQRFKKNVDMSNVEVEFLVGVEETCSLVNYLSDINFIIDLQILF